MDAEAERDSSKHLKVHFDVTCNETHTLPGKEACPSSSSSSSSSSESDSLSESTLTDRDESDSLTKSNHSSQELEGLVPSESYAQAPISSTHTEITSPLPLSYMAGRPAGYDPNRIPSTIFNSKPTNPTDWSVASNESLFSIHMGNNSFSRDQAFLLYKSGELTKLDEVFSVQAALPPVAEAVGPQQESARSSSATQIADLVKPSPQITELLLDEASPKTSNIDIKKGEDDNAKEKMQATEDVRNSTSMSTLSDGSGTSTASFAFPILGGTSEGNKSSIKVELKKEHSPESLPEQPEPRRATTARTTLTNWFSCFSCCSFRCSISLKSK
ncbi:hypothetical protein NL676_014792 [Syzygium grande]|nr:hypothetical protein NL676_014792 [Syzygium grande]